jgi:putative membrane protein
MMWNNGAWGAGDWLAMSLMMVAFWGLLIALIVWLVRGRRGSDPAMKPQPVVARADDVLAERFARGEIDEADFKRSRDLLHSSGTHT